jgi:hypothetical protein
MPLALQIWNARALQFFFGVFLSRGDEIIAQLLFGRDVQLFARKYHHPSSIYILIFLATDFIYLRGQELLPVGRAVLSFSPIPYEWFRFAPLQPYRRMTFVSLTQDFEVWQYGGEAEPVLLTTLRPRGVVVSGQSREYHFQSREYKSYPLTQ